MTKKNNIHLDKENEIKGQIQKVIDMELNLARLKFSREQASKYEGFAVLMEEFEELKELIEPFENYFKGLWIAVKNDSDTDGWIQTLEEYSFRMIEEGVQVAAMVKRFKEEANELE